MYDIQYPVSNEYHIFLLLFQKTALPSPLDMLCQYYNIL